MEMQCGAGMRVIAHPGAPLPVRVQAVGVEISPPMRVVVAPGHDLFEVIHEALDAARASGGSFMLEGGTAARVRLMTGGAGRDGLPMGFHGPHAMAAPLAIVAGAGGCGVDATGARFTHCHAAFRDPDGRLVGGHLIPGETIAGAEGIAVALVTIGGGRFKRRRDPETLFDIFHPEPA